MHKRRGMNKKAQEGMSFPALGALVLVVIVVVLLILVLSGAMDPILEKLKLLPGSGISGIVSACDTYVSLSQKTDYCTFREVKIDGRKQYVNCEGGRVQRDLKPESRGVLSCNENLVREQCAALFRQAKERPSVNEIECITLGITCGEMTGIEGGVKPRPEDQKCPPSDKLQYTRLVKNYGILNEQCCVIPQ